MVPYFKTHYLPYEISFFTHHSEYALDNPLFCLFWGH
jgi:hypothetical protein